MKKKRFSQLQKYILSKAYLNGKRKAEAGIKAHKENPYSVSIEAIYKEFYHREIVPKRIPDSLRTSLKNLERAGLVELGKPKKAIEWVLLTERGIQKAKEFKIKRRK